MTAATTPNRAKAETRLLVLEEGRARFTLFGSLPDSLGAGDLLVVNDAATLPASFQGVQRESKGRLEMRLVRSLSSTSWNAIFFGEGDWRTPTENRERPPRLQVGDIFEIDSVLRVKIERIFAGRLVEVIFLGSPAEIMAGIYRSGRPIQYSHLQRGLALWEVQTVFASEPVSLEAPSASFPFNWQMLFELEKRGVQILRLTHAAGISSSGDAALDAHLPLPESYWIPIETARAVTLALASGSRVIAVGTSVTRALESAADANGIVGSGHGIAELVITPNYRRKIVSGIVSGFHETGASHLKLLGSFVAAEKLAASYAEAEAQGFLSHEFGDSCLILDALTRSGALESSDHPLRFDRARRDQK